MELDLDDVTVVTLEAWHAPEDTSPGYWPCGRCGRPHDVTRSWNLVCETPSDRLSLIVCTGCADEARASR